MLAFLISILSYVLFLGLGNLLLFLDVNAYFTIPVFALFLLCATTCYKQANTRSLEKKDFLLALLFVCVLYYFYQYFTFSKSTVFFTYYYLAGFTSIVLYADSIRFKSLM